MSSRQNRYRIPCPLSRNLTLKNAGAGGADPVRVTEFPLRGISLFPGTFHKSQSPRLSEVITCIERLDSVGKLIYQIPASIDWVVLKRLADESGSVPARNSALLDEPSPSASKSGAPSGELEDWNLSNRHSS